MTQPYDRIAASLEHVRGSPPRRQRATRLLGASTVLWLLTWLDYAIEGGRVVGAPYPVWVGGLLAVNIVVTLHHSRLKRSAVRVLQKYVVNPPVRLALRLRLPLGWSMIRTTGRRTGRVRVTPVGQGLVDETFWIVAEHGTDAAYVKNLMAEPHVAVLVRRRGVRLEWVEGVATVLPDDDPAERQRWLSGWRHPLRSLNALIVCVLGTELVTIRVDLVPGFRRGSARAATRSTASRSAP